MDPTYAAMMLGSNGLPRTRGDGPGAVRRLTREGEASPHTRGWTGYAPPARERPHGFPAHAGMDRKSGARAPPRSGLPRTRGDGPVLLSPVSTVMPASPHTRGWTLDDRLRAVEVEGFPAHAGMDPELRGSASVGNGLPRTRGDRPRPSAFLDSRPGASPHTRGWTTGLPCWRPGACGFPAHAGMDPGVPIRGIGLNRSAVDGGSTRRH